MERRLTDYLLYALAAVLVFFILANGSAAIAGMIDTEGVLASEQSGQERERVKALLDRRDVASQMRAMGVSPAGAQGRIDAMTDPEIRALAGRLDSLPAGAAISDTNLMIIIVLLIVLALVL